MYTVYNQVTDANSLAYKLIDIGNVAIYLLIGLAIIYIIWNVVMYIIKGADPESKSEHIKAVGWGILGLAIILSIWGLVNILINTFLGTGSNMPTERIPTANFVGGNSTNSGYNSNKGPTSGFNVNESSSGVNVNQSSGGYNTSN